MPFGEGQRVRVTRITDGTSKRCFVGAVGTIGMVDPAVAGRDGVGVKDADCFYLLHFDRPIHGYRAAGFWGDEIEVAGATPLVTAVGAGGAQA